MSSHATDLYSVYAKSSSSFDLESAVRVTRDVGYLCANFNLLGLSVLDLDPMNASDRQTSDNRETKASLNGGGIITVY